MSEPSPTQKRAQMVEPSSDMEESVALSDEDSYQDEYRDIVLDTAPAIPEEFDTQPGNSATDSFASVKAGNEKFLYNTMNGDASLLQLAS